MAVVKRLSKVAKELNVGISTIVDHLQSIGEDVGSNPNAKIGEELYLILLKEFQREKFEKEKANEIQMERDEMKVISIKKEQEKAKEQQEKEKKETVIKASAEKLSGPSVLGKINIDSPKKDKVEAEKPAPSLEKEVKPNQEVLEKSTEITTDAVDSSETHSENEPVKTIKAEAKKLSGPTVLGKIELPKEKEKSTNSADSEDSQKRKRKRIKKVNVEKAGKKAIQEHRKSKKEQKSEVSEEEIQKEIRETLARLSNKGKSKGAKNRREKRQAVSERIEEENIKAEQEKNILKLTEFVTVSELGTMMDKSPNDVIGTLMSIGIFASINQRLDAETLTMVAEEYGFEVEFVSSDLTDSVIEDEQNPENMIARPPIVTVMGHVDHGKTSLLDYIRSAEVTAGEAGGITQHIGAYSVTHSDKVITFLDTPGHEAFTAMRARGAQVTDVAIIIVAADDKVMPQTKEAINHAQAAGVPMVFALNKCDRPSANPDKIKEELSAMNILVEDWGGKYQCQEVSAKTGDGIEELLEKVLLEAELLELKADPGVNAVGTVIEASLDKGRGYVTTLLVQYGMLRVGDALLAGTEFGKIKALHDEYGRPVKEAGPSKPVSVLGMNGAASAGDSFNVMNDEKEIKQIASKRQQLQREQGLRTTKHITLDEIGRRIALGDFQELNIIVKGDVDGSIEALSDSLLKLSHESIQINVIHKAVGQITESDILLASASDAIVVGFQVRPSAGARKLAEKEEIDVRLYSVIYKAIDEIKEAMEGMLSPDFKEEIVGTAEIRETFKISKVGTIAGCFVTEGKINRNNNVRVIRDGIVIYTGLLGSLKRFKDDVKEVQHNYECGLNIEKYNDIKVGDVVEAFQEVEVAKKL
ncbi:MAG: translation initiation factor IF-2 [Crocinitomicaceae bacterium]|nr:translation initiation factor IF-2 [Crocinitomicaceae bacterium]|tara:strand:- start:5833 stop:8442 length:2610 start_codon:yes stop_codon:yes gene_type:complete